MTVIDATETDRSLTPHALTGGTLAKIIAGGSAEITNRGLSNKRTDAQPLRQRTNSTGKCEVGNGRRFHRNDLDAWIRAGGVLAFT
jgi:hypothetical protein